MEEGQFLIIRQSACDQWFFYEKYRLAYSSANESARLKANILNWCTIAFGALTTASAALSESQYVTVAIGILTTVAAGLQQTFKWEEKAFQFWRARAEMEQVCRALKQYVSGVAMSRGISYDPLYEQRLAPPALEVYGLERFAASARSNLGADSISTLRLLGSVIEAADEKVIATENTVLGMTPVQRGQP